MLEYLYSFEDFVFFEIICLLKIISLSVKPFSFTKSDCLNLPAKVSAVNLF